MVVQDSSVVLVSPMVPVPRQTLSARRHCCVCVLPDSTSRSASVVWFISIYNLTSESSEYVDTTRRLMMAMFVALQLGRLILDKRVVATKNAPMSSRRVIQDFARAVHRTFSAMDSAVG